jgi:sec-independent protein translocase protein TatC
MALVPFPNTPPDRSRTSTERARKSPGSPDDDSKIQLTDPDELDENSRMSFLEHLDELRKRLIQCVYALVVGCVIAFFFVDRIQARLWQPLVDQLGGTKFMFTQGFEPFMLTMKIGALVGLLIASPYIIWQLWLFIAPGLYANEKRFAIPFVLFSSIFFLLGCAFSHYVAFPWTWKFFLGWQTTWMEFRPTIGETFSLYVKMLLGFALIFQMPTVVFFLARMGMVTAGFLLRHTKYAVLVIFIVAAVISPGTDVVSQTLMAGPMLGLYGISILIAWIFARKGGQAL